MALYTEISNDDFARMQQMWDEENRRKAAQEYNARKSKIDEKYNNDGGLGGFLGGIVGSIGKFVGDTAKGVGGLFGTAGASVKDLLEGKAGTAENTNAFKRYWYGGKDDADAAAKAAGTSLNAATNIATSVIPGLGAGGAAAKAAGGVAANTAAGALGGVADELQDQGSDASIESATNRALSGAAAGLATGGLNRKIGNAGSKVGSALLNNKLATSTIGRGALSGAVGGATGSATSAALGGGDIGQAALQGATSGAIGGATQAGIMSGVNRLGQRVANRRKTVGTTTAGPDLENANQPQENIAENTKKPIDGRKLAQFELIQEKNPMLDDYHTGIRSVDEIKTFGENVVAHNSNSEDFVYPDWTIDNARAAAKNGKVTIYSSKPIEEGAFVSPSKMMAQDYAGSGKVYSKEIPLDDVAWINGDEGNYAPIKDTTKIVRVEEPTTIIKNRNKVQQIGDELQQNARETKWQGLYENLDRKTAERAAKTNAPQRLERMGVTPENYEQYAKTSNYVNEQISKIAKDSGVKVNLPSLPDDLSLDNSDVVLSDQAAKKYNNYMRKIVADGNNPSEYSASYLLEKSRDLGDRAANLRGNTDDVKALRAALTDAKYVLRDAATNALEAAGITGDDTTAYIANGLKKLGANQDVIDYYSAPNGENAPNASDYIRRSSLFEQAREMATEAGAEKLSRNASKGKSNMLAQALEYTGLDKPVKTVGRNIIAPVFAKGQQIVGKGVTALGNMIDQGGSTPTQPLSQSTNVALGNAIGRLTGQMQASDAVQNARKEQEYQNLEDMFASIQTTPQIDSTVLTGNMMGGYGSMTQSNPLLGQMNQISNAMSAAMAVGDITAYNQLADLYKTAYNTYAMQEKINGGVSGSSSSNQKLSKTQQQANAAALSLEQLEGMNPDFGYTVSNIPILNLVNAQGNPYESTAKGLAMQIGYMLSGANIKDNEAEAIGRAYVPQPFDSDAVRKYKLQQARNIIQQYQNTYTMDDNNNLQS